MSSHCPYCHLRSIIFCLGRQLQARAGSDLSGIILSKFCSNIFIIATDPSMAQLEKLSPDGDRVISVIRF
eukprot:UN17951